MPLEGGEKVQGVLATIGQGDLPFLLAEEDRWNRFPFCGLIMAASHVDQVGEIDQPDLAPHELNPVAPGLVEDRIAGHRIEAPVVAHAVPAKGLELVDEYPLRAGAA